MRLVSSPLGTWTPPPFGTERKLAASSDGNGILTQYLDQAIYLCSQQNPQWLHSPTTQECLIRFASSLTVCQKATGERSRYQMSPRKTLPGFTAESRGRTHSNYTSGTNTSTTHSLPSQESWQLNNTAFILHFQSN